MRKTLMAVAAVVALLGLAVGGYRYLNYPPTELVAQLHSAVMVGDAKQVNELLAQNRRLARARYKKHTILVTAACTYSPIPHQTEICTALLTHGADPNAEAGAPLHGAIYCGNAELVSVLLQHGADPQCRPATSGGRTPYDDAKWRGVADIVKLFDERAAKAK